MNLVNSTIRYKGVQSEQGTPKIAVFLSFSGQGGVERMMLNLAEGLCSLGCQVDLVVVKARSAYLANISHRLRVIRLGASHTFGSTISLMQYLRRERPAAILSAKDRANIVAVVARIFSRIDTRLVLRMGTTVSAALEGKRPVKEKLWYMRMRVFYPHAHAVVAVSKGVARDLVENAHISPTLLHVVPNPVVTPQLFAAADQPLKHQWFKGDTFPVVLGAGRLTRQKDFETLIKAFARVRQSRPCRLMILGEGRDRSKLERLGAELGISSDMLLPGFVQNPYPYFKRASVFVLSSIWEGSPNVLTEALALGTPVVSTDCPNGPREILQDGRFGDLVPVGDHEALARAILETLQRPLEKSFLKSAVKDYTLEESSKRYLEVLLGSD